VRDLKLSSCRSLNQIYSEPKRPTLKYPRIEAFLATKGPPGRIEVSIDIDLDMCWVERIIQGSGAGGTCSFAFAFACWIHAKRRSSFSPSNESNHSLQTFQLLITTHCLLGVETFTQNQTNSGPSLPVGLERQLLGQPCRTISREGGSFNFLFFFAMYSHSDSIDVTDNVVLACAGRSAIFKTVEKVPPFIPATSSAVYCGLKFEDGFE
jgi:hypothetical protein